MDDKNFVWTSDLTKRLFKLRFENDWLFKKKKQPWGEFRNILLDHGFPKNMMVSHIRKKWSYTYDCYRLAKKTKNKSWRYYKIFDKHFGKTKILDKYENWPDEWRLRLITCISEAKELKVDFYDMWRTVEKAMRCQNLPNDCCIFDMKGLWHHIKMTFNRKHRLKIKKGSEYSEWPLYDAMLDYYSRFEPDNLQRLETEPASDYYIKRRNNRHLKYIDQDVDKGNDVKEFHWSKDITETFIQIRLQNDWLFREKKWAWNDLLIIMTEEYGFPKTLTSKDIRKKWASTFSEYQKAKATNNKQWVYYTLFELYLGEGRLSLNPLVEWQEEWVFHLIRTRSDCEHMFRYRPNSKNHNEAWREVEKKLRSLDLPLDHSLLELPEMWAHLLKTYKWKQKFANKGMLSEQWPYYDAMAQYVEVSNSFDIKKQKEEMDDNYCQDDDDIEDDMKLFDLKQQLQVKPKLELLDVNHCRSCSNEDGCVNIFQQTDDKGLDLAHKLRVIGGIEVEKSDHLPSQICFNCLQELENAYKFRLKCQETDQQLRNSASPHSIKVEIKVDGVDQQRLNEAGKNTTNVENNDFGEMESRYDVEFLSDTDQTQERKPVMKKEKQKVAVRMRKKTANGRRKYEYWKVCEVCGKHTRNLRSHLDAHATGKLYSCEVCDKKFKFKSGLIIHKAVHNPTPKKTCEICGKTFHILAQYRKHFVYHANERKFECETCGKRFNTLDILRVHRRMHTDERPFSCPECGKTFRTAGCVSRHRRIVHRKTMKIQ